MVTLAPASGHDAKANKFALRALFEGFRVQGSGFRVQGSSAQTAAAQSVAMRVRLSVALAATQQILALPRAPTA